MTNESTLSDKSLSALFIIGKILSSRGIKVLLIFAEEECGCVDGNSSSEV